jgi:hypothetical protein
VRARAYLWCRSHFKTVLNKTACDQLLSGLQTLRELCGSAATSAGHYCIEKVPLSVITSLGCATAPSACDTEEPYTCEAQNTTGIVQTGYVPLWVRSVSVHSMPTLSAAKQLTAFPLLPSCCCSCCLAVNAAPVLGRKVAQLSALTAGVTGALPVPSA